MAGPPVVPVVDDALGAFLVATLRARRHKDALTLISLPAPWLPLEPLWDALPSEPAMLWEPPRSPTESADATMTPDQALPHSLLGDGEASLGLGEVAADPERLAGLPVERLAPPGQAPGALRWLGGLPFTGAVAEPPWLDFPATAPSLPRWRYSRGPAGCAWHLTVHAATDSLIAQVAAEYRALTHAGAAPPAVVDAAPQVPLRCQPLPRARWQEWLARILQHIAHGDVDKVVAVRRTTLVFAQPLLPSVVLSRLRAQAPQSIRFALRRGAATFLGATPELLLRKRGRTVTTDALAGTVARGAGSLAELSAQLLGSDKDRREHAPVVEAIKQRLAPLCSDIEAPATPQIRVLPHLLHLHTPIRATTRSPSLPVLDLVRALHPTPAVGGTPTDRALQLIAAHEPQPRGYYAGPLGWYDEHGDGEFAVAIRSGVLLGNTAYVYGGAGIVRGSDPALEYAETATKMRTLLDALGVPRDLPDSTADLGPDLVAGACGGS